MEKNQLNFEHITQYYDNMKLNKQNKLILQPVSINRNKIND